MEYEIRTVAEAELEPYSVQLSRTFGHDFNPEFLELRKQTFEFDRNIATFDGAMIVGTAGIYSFDMTVPGHEAIGCAGVTMVTVRSTHRRQGVLTAMMRKQLHDTHEHGDPVAALWASEASIYGRFGYGLATQATELKLAREWSALRFAARAEGSVRLVETEEAKRTWPAFWSRLRLQTPGWVDRTETWWDVRVFRDPKDWRDGFTANFYAQYEDADGEIRGVARYRMKQNWDGGVPNGKLQIEEFGAETREAYAELWRFITSVDLVGTIAYENASVDEPLYWMLADSRRLERKTSDAIWLRIVDVERALGARRYAIEDRIVFSVEDPFLPWCDGRFELEGSPDGAICRPSNQEPDVTLSAADLGAAYLGGARLETMRRAGRVEGDARKVQRADLLFASAVAPHCPEHF